MEQLPKSTFLIMLLRLVLSLQCVKISAHGGDEESSSGNNKDLRSKGLILVKIWCLIILFVSTFAGGISPYFYRWNESFLLLGTQFAGGVFLGTSLMHFLSDSNSTFGDLTTKTYPFSFMLASAGYLLTMFGDCIVILVTKGAEKDNRVEVEEATETSDGYAKEEGMDQNPVLVRTTSVGDTILLILALCFHSVFEGIAVGVAGKLTVLVYLEQMKNILLLIIKICTCAQCWHFFFWFPIPLCSSPT